MKKRLLPLLLFPFFVSHAQELQLVHNKKKCASYEVLEGFRKANPGAETDLQFESWLGRQKSLRTNRTFATATLPVVFHIVYNTAGENVSQAAIQQQILQLNKDFSNQSASPYGVSANTQIQFALAQTDPAGNLLAQPGIDRIPYASKGFTAPPYTVGVGGSPNYLNTVIKPATIWDPAKYVNVWILPLADDILGIATFPSSSGLSGLNNAETNTTAGVAVVPEAVGSVFSPTGCGQYGKGRTLTHELGHFLGLRHIWGDASCGTDYCEDTPVHQDKNSGVPVHPKTNSCGTADEMFENFMDYSDDIVTNTFTADQVARMQTVLTASPRRNTLAASTVGLVSVTGSNKIAFADCKGTATITETGSTGTSQRYTDYQFTLNVEDRATANATLSLTAGGTGVAGFHYQLLTPVLNFASGEQYKTVTVRILDNALAEGNKTIALTYSLSGTGLTAGNSAQSMTITLLDDDIVTVAQGTVNLLTQSWELSTAGWGVLGTSGFANQFTVSSNGDAGGSGNVAHVTNNTTTRVNQYTNTAAGATVLRSPLINAAGITNLQVSFKYKAWGEVDLGTAIDYGALTYATQAAPSTFITLTASGAGPYAGTSAIASGTATVLLPNASFANRSFHLGWYWENDESEGNNPGLNVDDIVLTGSGTPVETAVSTSYGYPVPQGSGLNHFRSTNNRMIASLTNASAALSGVTASVTAAGSGQTTITTSGGTFQRTEKVFRITSGTTGNSAYRITLYFTPAELAIWGANKLNLKVLKLKDGVALNGPINSGNAVLVTPVSALENTETGVVTYTADFTDGFSQYVLVSQNFVLPVSLVNFEAKPAGAVIVLGWKTASEQANKGFAVERGTNGTDYLPVGWVDGAGTTATPVSYTFTDGGVQSNLTYYYRLRQVDIDGRFRYSDVRQARINGEAYLVSVNPNPVRGRMKVVVTGSSAPVAIALVNSKGQTVGRWQAVNAATGYEVNVSRFSKGYYTLVVHLPGGDQSVPVLLQ